MTENEIVISGIAGRYPNSDNIYEFWNNLVSGQELSSCDERRWPLGFMGLPFRAGKVNYLEKFDAHFFGVNEMQADFMDPQYRIFYEVAYEAIIDAGIIPEDLRGSNTAICVGVCYDDTNATVTQDISNEMKAYKSTRERPYAFSQSFGFTGPAFEVDTACASSFTALFEGILLMKASHCNKLVVGGVACHLRPGLSRGFVEMRMISNDGRSKCLDASVDGYCRSEAINAIFIERRGEAKRIYASIIDIETNTDGFKQEGITFPGYETQKILMQETLRKTAIDPLSINYIEAHVTGTVAGDTTESQSILDSYREKSDKPIMFGCLKSNMGHTEGASTNCSIAKVALIFQKHSIPPNINYKNPNPNIKGLMSGQIIPVLKNTEFHDEIIPVNSFGFGGVNVHALLKANEKVVNEDSYNIVGTIPRIVNISGRTEEGLNSAMNWIEHNRKDITKDFLALLNDISKTPTETGMNCRAFMILDEANVLQKRVFRVEKRRPLWFVFSALGCQWKGMAKELITFPVFSSSIRKCAEVLKTVDVDLMYLLNNERADVETNIISALVTIVSIQVAVVDLLYFLGVEPDGIIGYSIGEVGAGYADGCLTAEEAVLTSYYLAKYSKKYQPENGAMAAVGLSWTEVESRAFPGVFPVCDNSSDGITVSGSKSSIAQFIREMNEQDVFVKLVNSCDMAYHCELSQPGFKPLLAKLKNVIKTPKLISDRMLSTSASNNGEKMFIDAHYYANNIISPVKFKQAISTVPENACVVEIGPSPILLSIVKRNLPNSHNVCLLKRDSDNAENILSGIGGIYGSGNNVKIENLYPKVTYPVARETLSISHLLQWDHSKNLRVTKIPEYFNITTAVSKREMNFMSQELRYIDGHCIDGRNLFPATGYLYFVWKQFSYILGTTPLNIPIEFKQVKFKRATIVPKSGVTTFEMLFNEHTGKFAIVEGGAECVTGFISLPTNDFCYEIVSQSKDEDKIKLNGEEIYKELRVRGYDYGPSFQGLVEAVSDGSKGKVKWTGEWVSFTDSMLHLSIFGSVDRSLKVPTEIEYMRCDSGKFLKAIEAEGTLDVYFDQEANIGYSNGIVIKGLNGTPIQRRTENQSALLLEQRFMAYDLTIKTSQETISDIETYLDLCCVLLHRVHANRFEVTEEEEKSIYNNDLNDDYAFYRKLVDTLKNKVAFEEFFETVTEAERVAPIFKSSFDEIINIQVKQILENLPQRSINIMEYNTTDFKIKEEVADTLEFFAIKYEIHSIPSQVTDQSIPPSLSDMNLIFYKDASTELITDEKCLKNKDEIATILNAFYNSMRENAFLLFTFRTKLTSLEEDLLTLRNMSDCKLHNEEIITSAILKENFTLIGQRRNDLGIVSLIAKKVTETRPAIIVTPDHLNFEWVDDVKECLKNEKNDQNVWLFADESQINGVVGLTRCLTKEPGGQKIRCFVSNEKIIPSDVLSKDLVMNIFKNGLHGLYIHTEAKVEMIEAEHSYLDVKTKGDLSSFQWYEAPHKNWSQIAKKENNGVLVNIYYGALNFKDIMVASGRIPLSAYPHEFYACGNLGMEFSGIDGNGNRVMGITHVNALATTILLKHLDYLWPVPKSWTLEEAATVPVVYMTVLYGLIIRGKLRAKESILIHAGSGGIGQAAITVCLDMGCEVFTSVGTKEKKQFLKDLFPQLEERHFVNSRDCSFEEHILKETNGRGVDVILNSLAEEKLRASINCLADFGRFVEIGKYDIIQNNPFDSTLFQRNQTFHVICVAHLMCNQVNVKEAKQTKFHFTHFLMNGVIKPLKATVFDMKEAEKAFRFMASGKHIGKVLLKIREENASKNMLESVKSIPQTFCFPSKVYVLIGGLGGLGLELAFWLWQRGARQLVITSRTGVKSNYQRYIIKHIEEAGAIVNVLVNDASTYESTEIVMKEALKLGRIGGVFNLAMELKDALMENQTEETYKVVCNPKVNTTLFLDQLTRSLCSDLDYFVCFSSFASGGGNTGQSNYGFANSVMETICEKRRVDNLHAIAVQWGPIGDTGFFMDRIKSLDVIHQKYTPQRIPSFLNSLDTLMNSSYAICCSILPAKSSLSQSAKKGDLLKIICYILGVNDPSTLEDSTTLVSLGMDSLMAVEIKQGLERDYNVVLSTQEIRQLTIKEIKEISKRKFSPKEINIINERNAINPFELPSKIFVNLDEGNQGVPIFFIPPVEGDFKLMLPLVKYISRPVVAMNWTEEVNEKPTIEEVAAFYVEKLREEYKQTEYEFVAYSFGAFVAFEMSLQLQALDPRSVKKMFFLDGDIPMMKNTTMDFIERQQQLSERDAYRELVIAFMSVSKSAEIIEKFSLELNALNTKEEMLNKAVHFISTLGGYECNVDLLSATIERYYSKMRRVQLYIPSTKFSGNIKFICSVSDRESPIKFSDVTHKDVDQLVDGNVDVITKTGDHVTFLSDNIEEIGNLIEYEFRIIYA